MNSEYIVSKLEEIKRLLGIALCSSVTKDGEIKLQPVSLQINKEGVGEAFARLDKLISLLG